MLLALLLFADPTLASPSPFSLQLLRAGNALHGAIFNHSQHPHTYLYDRTYQPVALIVRDEAGKYYKAIAPQEPPPNGAARVYKKDYIRLDQQHSASLDDGAITGSALERFEIRFGRFRCSYLPAGRFYLSLLWRSSDAPCFDCSAVDKERIAGHHASRE